MKIAWLRVALATACLLGFAAMAWRLFGPRGVEVELLRKSWRLEIEVERQIAELGSAWCDELPAGAQVQSRRLLADPAGRRSQPAEHCRYTLPTWRALWQARQAGLDPEPPRWPQPILKQGSDELSPQRLGKRHEVYELELQAASGQAWVCALPLAQWRALPKGLKFRLAVDRQGVADCASVPGANISPPTTTARSP
ncbi:hypothetical protein HNP55_003918 [Paucibacter oligotrophus]|uniref:Uncharacterized protein n=1 Tax=Roseateles oligotrophus TaxID=1769250 RepID=A0A840LGM2_9BURK|nr:hypothetical protein [Roseateles oligotrophus]MBB4845368.1 hypothetical protein [Roseateles oligotrophus]